MTELAPGAQTITKERVDERLDEGDHERLSHFVDKSKLTEATFTSQRLVNVGIVLQ